MFRFDAAPIPEVVSLEILRDRLETLVETVGRPVKFMEVCGTHTVSVFRNGLASLFPGPLSLISGPGCPVCVTAQRDIDAAVELAARPGLIMATYGDMLRVPGHRGSLQDQRARGGDVRVVYSARGALRLAENYPEREVVFLGVGFETTAPATAAVVREARRRNLVNFSVLSSHKRIVPAMRALLLSGKAAVDGFLCPGHVSVIIGSQAFEPLVSEFQKPCVIAGFEPMAIMTGLVRLVNQVREGSARVENPYRVAVSEKGNRVAQELLEEVFQPTTVPWRALGEISDSGWVMRSEYKAFDAARRFDVRPGEDRDHPGCRCGEVICGRATPEDCSLFRSVCTPSAPLGPCMVSGEGTCAAWFKYHRPSSTSAPTRSA